jgi:hypothetical protein
MSTHDEEVRALDDAFDFLLALGSGRLRVKGNITEVRSEARRIVKHFPLSAGERWYDTLK